MESLVADEADTVIDPVECGYPKEKLKLFLMLVIKALPLLAEKLNFSTSQISEQMFTTTLPSLFGYYWCDELASSYVDFLFKAFDVNPTFTRQHLILSLTFVMKIACGRDYYREIFEEPILRLVYGQIDISVCASMIANNMTTMASAPQILRKVIQMAEKSEVKWTGLEFLIACIIVPTLLNPKEVGAISAQVPLVMDQLSKLAEVCILMKSVFGSEDSQIRSTLVALVKHVCEGECLRDGISVQSVISLLNSRSMKIQLTFNDINLLAALMRKSNITLQLTGISDQLVSLKCSKPYIFHEVTIEETTLYGINEAEGSDDSDDIDEEGEFADALFKLLLKAPIVNEALGDSIEKFLEFHNNYAVMQQNFDAQLLISNCRRKSDGNLDSQWPILTRKLAEMRAHRDNLNDKLMEILVINDNLTSLLSKITLLMESATDSRTSRLYKHFLDENPAIQKEVTENARNFISDQKLFADTFTKALKPIFHFAKDQTHLSRSLVIHHHAWMMGMTTFDSFKSANQEWIPIDNLIQKSNDKVITVFCLEPAPQKTRKLFHNVAINEAVLLLREACLISNPVIAMTHMERVISVLNGIFTLNYNAAPQADELTPLIHYVILKSRCANICTFVKYVETFTSVLTSSSDIISHSQIISLTHIINHMDSLAHFLRNFNC